MAQERGSLGVAEVGGLIYAMGGGTGGPNSVNLDTIEVFTPDLNAWQSGPSMHEQRFTTSGGAVNGALYVTGGFDGIAYLSTAECLDPVLANGNWCPLQPLCHVVCCTAVQLYLICCHPHFTKWAHLLAPSKVLDTAWQLGSCLMSTVAI